MTYGLRTSTMDDEKRKFDRMDKSSLIFLEGSTIIIRKDQKGNTKHSFVNIIFNLYNKQTFQILFFSTLSIKVDMTNNSVSLAN